MATTTHPITVEEFDRLLLPPDKDRELHDGEVVEVSIAHIRHRRLQKRLVEFLEESFPEAEVLMEYPCRIGDYDKRSAVVSLDRTSHATEVGILTGAPEIVVEGLSPLNSAEDLRHYMRVCLNNGTLLFLVVAPKDRTVDLAMPGTPVITYCIDNSIPIAVIGSEPR